MTLPTWDGRAWMGGRDPRDCYMPGLYTRDQYDRIQALSLKPGSVTTIASDGVPRDTIFGRVVRWAQAQLQANRARAWLRVTVVGPHAQVRRWTAPERMPVETSSLQCAAELFGGRSMQAWRALRGAAERAALASC